MDEYILIFRHPNGKNVASPEQMKTWMDQTNTWMQGIAAQNKLVGGFGASFEESRVVRQGGKVSEGVFGSGDETVGGYLVVKAESMDEAAEFAKGSPVLGGEGNSVEVRKLLRG